MRIRVKFGKNPYSNDLIKQYHHRMPVILVKEDEDTWLDPDITDVSVVTGIIRQYPADEMKAYEVSTAVNSPWNDSVECVEPK